jgi:hypothetical protein
MARKIAQLIFAIAAMLAMGGAVARDRPGELKTPQTPWHQVPREYQRALQPVAPEWDRMPGYQQQRLMGAARKYPNMQPIQRERFDARLKDWASMTADQRRAARETFQGLRKLPPEKQHELRERWIQQHGGEDVGAPRSRGPSTPDYSRAPPR